MNKIRCRDDEVKVPVLSEVEYAQKQDKRIVGVWAQGSQDADLPKSLDQYADAGVGWQADRVMGAITGKINDHSTPEGGRREPREIPRYSCG